MWCVWRRGWNNQRPWPFTHLQQTPCISRLVWQLERCSGIKRRKQLPKLTSDSSSSRWPNEARKRVKWSETPGSVFGGCNIATGKHAKWATAPELVPVLTVWSNKEYYYSSTWDFVRYPDNSPAPFMIFRWHIIHNTIIWSALQQFVGDFGQIALDSLQKKFASASNFGNKTRQQHRELRSTPFVRSVWFLKSPLLQRSYSGDTGDGA